ncbi:MAG: aromatic amino acid lyase, partial [Terrabacter sp.]|nr:aromatic amino acid lyase [Terrabacter sp.]
MTRPMHLDGHSLDLDALERAACGAVVSIDPAAMAAAEASHRYAAEVSTRRAVYGRTTGVGAARDESTDSEVDHGLRLLRSHAAGWGEVMPSTVVRAALAVRANQLLAGGSGANPVLAQALANLVGAPDGDLPVVHRYGSLGTGDLTALAEVGLALIGERERSGGGHRADLQLTSADALPLMSSNAFAIAETGLHAAALHALARAADTVCALSFVALQ